MAPGLDRAVSVDAVTGVDVVFRANLAPHRVFVGTGFRGVGATGPEAAPRRGVHRARYVPFEDHALALQFYVGVWDGDRREEGLGVRVQRVAVELVAWRHLHHRAEVHDPDAV